MEKLSNQNQEEVTGGKTIHMPSMEEQLARFIHMNKVNGMSAEKLAEELSAKFELPLARAKATVEKYW